MKNIYRLLSVTILSLSTYFLEAQNIDTTDLQRNENGKISFAHILSITNMADATNFLKTSLETSKDDSLALIKVTTDELNMIHKLYQQYYKGIKVENAEYIVHGRNGIIKTINGDFQIVNIASVSPNLSEQQALKKALEYVNAKEYKWQDSSMEKFIREKTNNPNATYDPKGVLVIEKDYLKGGKNLVLSWKFSISSLKPDNEQLIYVDANTGEIINKTPEILDANTPLTAQTIYSGTLAITGDSFGASFRLEENRNGVSIETLNAQNTSNIANAIDFTNTNTNFTSGSWPNFSLDQQALDAHWGAENVLDFWRTVFNRNSLDGSGIPIFGYVHYTPHLNGTPWSNAQWVSGTNNHFMEYGDGDGNTFTPWTSLDVCAHEMGHGINEFTANLTPGTQESGALNEGFSDIWGAV
jgi:Zn-dependent metalloprotease